MRNLSLYIAMSLDGFIADSNGGIDWLHGQGAEPDTVGSYPEFAEGVDTVLMGWNTYHQITCDLSPDEWPYEGMEAWVFTHRGITGREGVRFTDESLTEAVGRLKSQPGRGIWLCGGADLAQQAMREGLVDRLWISVIPTLLGEGIRLFQGKGEVRLTLVETQTYDGIVDLVYEVQEAR